MKRLAICSLMRAGSEYEQAYYLQILALSRRTFEIQSVNVLYDTEPIGSAWLRELLRSHGVPVYYQLEVSIEGNASFDDLIRRWAVRCNQCLELALSHGEDLTHLAWIEADLSYPYDTLEALVGRDKPIIAPLIYLNNTFYDSWGFRDLNGVRITQFPPMMPVTEGEPIELRSVGSFVVFDIAVFRSNIRFRGEYEQGLLVGISEDAAKIGLKTFVDPMISIFHPVSAWREQMWYCKRLRVFADGTPLLDIGTPATAFGHIRDTFINEWLDQILGKPFGNVSTRRLSIRRDAAQRTFETRVDFEPIGDRRAGYWLRIGLLKFRIKLNGIRARLKVRTRLKRFANRLVKSFHDSDSPL
jgi:hypothetical protein